MGAPLGPRVRGAGGEGGRGRGRKRRRRRRRRELPPHMAPAGGRAEGALARLCPEDPGRGARRGPGWASGEQRHPRPGLAAAAAAAASPHVGRFPRMHLPPPSAPRPRPASPGAPRSRLAGHRSGPRGFRRHRPPPDGQLGRGEL